MSHARLMTVRVIAVPGGPCIEALQGSARVGHNRLRHLESGHNAKHHHRQPQPKQYRHLMQVPLNDNYQYHSPVQHQRLTKARIRGVVLASNCMWMTSDTPANRSKVQPHDANLAIPSQGPAREFRGLSWFTSLPFFSCSCWQTAKLDKDGLKMFLRPVGEHLRMNERCFWR